MALCLSLKNAGIPFKALHFNHNLRTNAANEEKWLKDLCRSWGVEFISGQWQVAPSSKGRTQEEARAARYEFFTHACKRHNLSHLLVAHTRDDIAETVLMRLFYGSGLTGLKGITPVKEESGFTLHRPLLGTTRGVLRAYLEENNQPWLEDPSNYKADYVRVRARHWLKQMPDDLTDALLDMAEKNTELDAALKVHMEKYKTMLYFEGEKRVTIQPTVLDLPDYARARLFKKVFRRLQPTRYPPRPQKQHRLIQALKAGDKPHSVGEVTFIWQEGAIIATPEAAG